jgi:hypothetical protein
MPRHPRRVVYNNEGDALGWLVVALSGRRRKCAHSRNAAWPSGVLGFLVFIAFVEVTIARNDREWFTTSMIQSWRATGQAAKREAKKCDVLLFGDSAIKFDVSPHVIESETGLRAYNLAPYGGPPPASYLLLRRALDAGSRPKAVVVDAMPHLLAASPAQLLRPWQEIASARECFDLGCSTRDRDFFTSLVLGRLLPSYRDRAEIRESVRLAFEGRSLRAIIGDWVAPNRRNWRLNRGGELRADNPEFGDDGSFDRPNFTPERWSCDPAAAAYWDRFLSLCEDRGIAVYWLFPPISPTPQRERLRSGLDARYDDFARRVLSLHPGVRVLDARSSRYDRSAFTDPVHLTRRGAVALTLDIAPFLRAPATDVPLWNTLPAFRARPGGEGLEDLQQSRVAALGNRGLLVR